MRYQIGPDEPVGVAVVSAVSAAEECAPKALPQLTEAVNPDALNELFAPKDEGPTRRSGTVSFDYSNSRVTIERNEHLTVEPLDVIPTP